MQAEGLFTCIVIVTVSVSVAIKVEHCVIGNRLIDRQIGYRTHSPCQTVCLHSHNVNLMETDMEKVTVTDTVTVPVNRP